MTDNELIVVLRRRIMEGVTATNWQCPVVQKFQPTQQGTQEIDPLLGNNAVVYFEKLFDRPYGWAGSKSEYRSDSLDYLEKETQLYESTFQISALTIQNPADLSLPTASDIVNYMKMWLNHRVTVEVFMAQDINVLRITDVRNVPFEDDRHRFEYNPTFDIVMTHYRKLDITVPSAVVEGNTYSV